MLVAVIESSKAIVCVHLFAWHFRSSLAGAVMQAIDNPRLAEVAKKVQAKLQRVIDG
jgi:hypothetical protein